MYASLEFGTEQRIAEFSLVEMPQSVALLEYGCINRWDIYFRDQEEPCGYIAEYEDEVYMVIESSALDDAHPIINTYSKQDAVDLITLDLMFYSQGEDE